MSILNTRMQNVRVKAKLDEKEIRLDDYGALNACLAQTNSPTGIITPDIQAQASAAVGLNIEAAVIEDQPNLTIGNTRDLVIVDRNNTSRMITFQFVTYATGFTQVPAAFANNEISIARDWEAQYKLTSRLFGEALNNAVIAKLETNKTQVIKDPLLYTELANTLIAKYSQRENIVGDIETVMKSNNFKGTINVVGSTSFDSIVRGIMTRGKYNETNQGIQLQNKTITTTNDIPSGVGKYATGYACMQDTMGIVFRHEREAVANNGLGRKMADGTEWKKDFLDLIGIPVSTYYYESRANEQNHSGAATADMTRVFKQHFGYAIDAAIEFAFISEPTTRPTPVLKFQINREETDNDTESPTVENVSSVDTLNVSLEFAEAVCTDQAGTKIEGDIKDLFTITAATPAGVAIDSAIASEDGKTVVFTILDPNTNLASGDTISIDGNAIYDGAGNVFDQTDNPVATVNGGGTAWV